MTWRLIEADCLEASRETCPTCGSVSPTYRNPIGNHAPEDAEPEYEWCIDLWHEGWWLGR